ncbi:MAG: hypothetical protein H6Q33_1748 [Deltaproteobacteria bacterium]|nr:hypothetical protein [Deltaproteobacteria bacterium]
MTDGTLVAIRCYDPHLIHRRERVPQRGDAVRSNSIIVTQQDRHTKKLAPAIHRGKLDCAPPRRIRGGGEGKSGRRDLNPRPLAPQASALPVCATPRHCTTAMRHLAVGAELLPASVPLCGPKLNCPRGLCAGSAIERLPQAFARSGSGDAHVAQSATRRACEPRVSAPCGVSRTVPLPASTATRPSSVR